MYGKILIACELVVCTGLHIGASSGFSAIGAVDNPVIRDSWTGYPIVPGSSLKGKLRTLLVRDTVEDATRLPECRFDPPDIKGLFGSTEKASLLQFMDCPLMNKEEMEKIGFTSVKAENCIDRRTGKATNPRFVERVNPGARFYVRIIYNAYEGIVSPVTKKNMALLARGMKALQQDYLGGHGSRGSGVVSFRNFHLDTFPNENADISALQNLFVPVEEQELFPVLTDNRKNPEGGLS